METHTHVVQKQFEGAGGRIYKSGEKIDASSFRNLNGLVTARYLKPLHGEQGTEEIIALLGDLRAVIENQSTQIETLSKRMAALEQNRTQRR